MMTTTTIAERFIVALVSVLLAGIAHQQHQAGANGVFELRLVSFDNSAGRDDSGQCCSQSRTPVDLAKANPSAPCESMCRPRFRVCLKEYQVKIDPKSACTFGDVITTELDGDRFVSRVSDHRFDRSVNIPFNFSWPHTFSLIVEAWHTNQTTHTEVLVSRLTRQKWLDPSDQWTEDEHCTKYTTMKFQYRVTCDPHHYGNTCKKLCRPRDDSFGHFICTTTGERVCMAGWTGEYCNMPVCLPGCHDTHGHCSKPNECLCHSGWEGELCDKCQTYPGCVHGTCVKQWDCLCNEGWGGLFCNQDLNFCTNHKPCRNGGTCYNSSPGSYTCNCPIGYGGTNCELEMDVVAEPVPTLPPPSSSMPPPTMHMQFMGGSRNCTESGACLNGGQCRRSSSRRAASHCVCPVGYEGDRCQRRIAAPCGFAANTGLGPCQNGGTCRPLVRRTTAPCPGAKHLNGSTPPTCFYTLPATADDYQCICAPGYEGQNCETNIDDCLTNPCYNGGTCIDQVNSFRCQCVPGYVGGLCQKRVDYCVTKPCANNGTCHQLLNDYRCECAPGFGGRDCSQTAAIASTRDSNDDGFASVALPVAVTHGHVMLADCFDVAHQCLNGGTCVPLATGGAECRCPESFTGTTCGNLISPSSAARRRLKDSSGADGLSDGQDDDGGSRAAESSRDDPVAETLATEHVVVIATISTFVPMVVLVAVAVLVCLKRRQRREKTRADEEARLQNEQNTANSSFTTAAAAAAAAAKRHHQFTSSGASIAGGGIAQKTLVTGPDMIKNTWTVLAPNAKYAKNNLHGGSTSNVAANNTLHYHVDDMPLMGGANSNNYSSGSSASDTYGYAHAAPSLYNGKINAHTHHYHQQEQQQQIIDGRPVLSLQRSRSHKQLNTEQHQQQPQQQQQQQQSATGTLGATAAAVSRLLLATKLHLGVTDSTSDYSDAPPLKRLSVLSNSSASQQLIVCTTTPSSSECSLLKRPSGMDNLLKDSNSVYVIEEHFPPPTQPPQLQQPHQQQQQQQQQQRPDVVSPSLFATEV